MYLDTATYEKFFKNIKKKKRKQILLWEDLNLIQSLKFMKFRYIKLGLVSLNPYSLQSRKFALELG